MVPVIEALETHVEVATTMWKGSASRPGRYPVGLPFLADRPATMLSLRESTTLEWEGTESSSVATLARMLLDAGWVETTLPDPSMPGMTIRPFRRGDRQRVLIHDGRLLTLLDTRAE